MGIIRTKSFWFLVIIVVIGWLFKFEKHYPNNIDLQAKENFWGVTYSAKFAESLGLDWQEAYLAILDDLQVKNIRIPIYWDQIEQTEGEFDFARYDYIFSEGKNRDVNFIANIGWRLPRWPECHNPAWANDNSESEIQAKMLLIIERVITHYKEHDEIVAWQIENEPLLDWFGECPKGDRAFLEKEVALVKAMDERPIIISASGELSTWRQETKIGDIFATTMYRVVWNPIFRYVRYPIPDWFYKVKLYFNGVDRQDAIISELQTEPWVPNGTLADLEFTEFNKSFDIEQFKANLQFAINTDFRQAYLWGVEWWYLQKQAGHGEYWGTAKHLFISNQ